jgi:hypothetical protein
MLTQAPTCIGSEVWPESKMIEKVVINTVVCHTGEHEFDN